MNVALKILESPEVLAFLWALITGLLSLVYHRVEARWPNAIAALRAGGLDLPRLAVALRPVFAWALELLRALLRRTPPAVVFLVLVGCGAGQKIAEFAEGARDVAEIAEPCARGALEAELARCDDRACVEAVERKYAAPMAALDAFNALLCALAPDTEGCK